MSCGLVGLRVHEQFRVTQPPQTSGQNFPSTYVTMSVCCHNPQGHKLNSNFQATLKFYTAGTTSLLPVHKIYLYKLMLKMFSSTHVGKGKDVPVHAMKAYGGTEV